MGAARRGPGAAARRLADRLRRHTAAARGISDRLRHPRTTVRWRLTLLYGGLFLVCGAALLAITYTLVSNATMTSPLPREVRSRQIVLPGGGAALPNPPFRGRTPRFIVRGQPPTLPAGGVWLVIGGQKISLHKVIGAKNISLHQISGILHSRNGPIAFRIGEAGQRLADLHQLVEWSAIALAIMAVLSMALGWLVAGRVLAPLRTITQTAREISEENLHRRLDLDGPPDELHELAGTIDGLLARLQHAFDAQRAFVANASHELRTPLTATRALLEMALSDPRATAQDFREVTREALVESEQQERLIDALLALAQGERGVVHREAVDLGELAAGALAAQAREIAARGLLVETSLEPSFAHGDRRLLERLVVNLVENAVRHNLDGGLIELRARVREHQAVLEVANSGERLPEADVERLLEPFQRFGRERTGNGFGLGLSIVQAISSAHRATLAVAPRDGGGLQVEIGFPRAPAPASQSTPPTIDATAARAVTAAAKGA